MSLIRPHYVISKNVISKESGVKNTILAQIVFDNYFDILDEWYEYNNTYLVEFNLCNIPDFGKFIEDPINYDNGNLVNIKYSNYGEFIKTNEIVLSLYESGENQIEIFTYLRKFVSKNKAFELMKEYANENELDELDELNNLFSEEKESESEGENEGEATIAIPR